MKCPRLLYYPICWYASKMYSKWPTIKANTATCVLDSSSTDHETRSSHRVFSNVAASVVEPRKDDPRVVRRNEGKSCLTKANKAECNYAWECHIKIQIYQTNQHSWATLLDMKGLDVNSTANMQPLPTMRLHWSLMFSFGNFVSNFM